MLCARSRQSGEAVSLPIRRNLTVTLTVEVCASDGEAAKKAEAEVQRLLHFERGMVYKQGEYRIKTIAAPDKKPTK